MLPNTLLTGRVLGNKQDVTLLGYPSAFKAVSEVLNYLDSQPRACGVAFTTDVASIQDYDLNLRKCISASSLGDPGNLLVDAATINIVRDRLTEAETVLNLGSFHIDQGLRKENLSAISRHPSGPMVGTEPGYSGSFIGREVDLESIAKHCLSARVVSIIGLPGIGKSALLKRILLEQEETGTPSYLVDLTGKRYRAELLAETCKALGIELVASEAAASRIFVALGDMQATLAFDGANDLTGELRNLVVPLIKTCPNVQVLLTQNQRLQVDGEIVYRLSGLPVPNPCEGRESILASDSVGILLDRMQLLRPGYSPDAKSAELMARIVDRLSGNPLAIELVAQKTLVFDLKTILSRLDDSLAFLTSKKYAAENRSLVASYGFLVSSCSKTAQKLLSKLAVVPGFFTHESVVGSFASQELAAEDIEEALSNLIERSLVEIAETGTDVRAFRIPELVRQYLLTTVLNAKEAKKAVSESHAWARKALTECSARNAHDGDALMSVHLPLFYEVIEKAATTRDRDWGVEVLLNTNGFWLSVEDRKLLSTLISKYFETPNLEDCPHYGRLCAVAVFAGIDYRPKKALLGIAKLGLYWALAKEDMRSAAGICNSLSAFYQTRNRHRSSLRMSRYGYEFAVKAGVQSLVIITVSNYIGCLCHVGKYQKSQELLDHAFPFVLKHGSSFDKANLYADMAFVAYRLEEKTNWWEYFGKWAEEMSDHVSPRLTLHVAVTMIRCLIYEKRFELAREVELMVVREMRDKQFGDRRLNQTMNEFREVLGESEQILNPSISLLDFMLDVINTETSK